MKKSSIRFLQAVIVLVGLVVLAIMARFPMTEGRAANLDLFHIYADPFILYGYTAAIPFFIALYQAFTLLIYIGQNKVFSLGSVHALRMIKRCAITQGVLVILAALYIRAFHDTNDDPAGFIAIAIIATFIAAVFATAAAVFEKLLQSAVEMKSENDLTV